MTKFRVIRGQRFIDGHPNVYYVQSNHRTLEAATKAGKKINTTYQNNSVGNFFFLIQDEVEGTWKVVSKIKANNVVSQLFFKE
jgi:hypothetical protein